jgi:hypothetical protein
MQLSLLPQGPAFASFTTVTLSVSFVMCSFVAVFEVSGLIYLLNDLSPCLECSGIAIDHARQL